MRVVLARTKALYKCGTKIIIRHVPHLRFVACNNDNNSFGDAHAPSDP